MLVTAMRKKEVIDACPTDHDDTGVGTVCATVLQTGLAARSSAACGLDPSSPGKRTVSSALRAMGLGQEKRFHCYHRVLNRAVWSGQEASSVLLKLLVKTFVTDDGPLVVGLDETLERRWGAKIAAKGVYRDAVRSSHERFVKASGLRWACMMLLVPVPWASRVWALPFLSVLAPSERYNLQRGKPHKKLTDWARQMILLPRRSGGRSGGSS